MYTQSGLLLLLRVWCVCVCGGGGGVFFGGWVGGWVGGCDLAFSFCDSASRRRKKAKQISTPSPCFCRSLCDAVGDPPLTELLPLQVWRLWSATFPGPADCQTERKTDTTLHVLTADDKCCSPSQNYRVCRRGKQFQITLSSNVSYWILTSHPLARVTPGPIRHL